MITYYDIVRDYSLINMCFIYIHNHLYSLLIFKKYTSCYDIYRRTFYKNLDISLYQLNYYDTIIYTITIMTLLRARTKYIDI